MGSLRTLVKKQETIPVEIADVGTIAVTFRPAAYNDAVEAVVQGAIKDARGSLATIRALLALVAAWDLTWDEADPEPVPLTREALAEVPVIVLGAILEAVGEAMRPDPKPSNA